MKWRLVNNIVCVTKESLGNYFPQSNDENTTDAWLQEIIGMLDLYGYTENDIFVSQTDIPESTKSMTLEAFTLLMFKYISVTGLETEQKQEYRNFVKDVCQAFCDHVKTDLGIRQFLMGSTADVGQPGVASTEEEECENKPVVTTETSKEKDMNNLDTSGNVANESENKVTDDKEGQTEPVADAKKPKPRVQRRKRLKPVKVQRMTRKIYEKKVVTAPDEVVPKSPRRAAQKAQKMMSHVEEEEEEEDDALGGDVCSDNDSSISDEKDNLVVVEKQPEDDNKQEDFICSICGKVFNKKGNLKRHQERHSGLKVWTCEEEGCNKSFNTEEYLKRHRRIHSESWQNREIVKTHQCDICNKCFELKGQLRRHRDRHSEAKNFTCNFCTKGFKTEEYLRRHMKYLHDYENPDDQKDKEFPCKHCGKIYHERSSLRYHLKTHSGDRPYLCASCPKAFDSKYRLARHEAVHRGDKPYPCSVCGKPFRRKDQLNRHMSMHSGERPYQCELCGSTFARPEHLKIHQDSHNDVKRFKCPSCPASFSQKSTLKAHEFQHTGVKPYCCDLCGKSFNWVKNLKSHILSHKGLRPYVCPQCGKTFLRADHLSRHLKTCGGAENSKKAAKNKNNEDVHLTELNAPSYTMPNRGTVHELMTSFMPPRREPLNEESWFTASQVPLTSTQVPLAHMQTSAHLLNNAAPITIDLHQLHEQSSNQPMQHSVPGQQTAILQTAVTTDTVHKLTEAPMHLAARQQHTILENPASMHMGFQ